jgi:hypothetical protein
MNGPLAVLPEGEHVVVLDKDGEQERRINARSRKTLQ